LNDFEIAMTS